MINENIEEEQVVVIPEDKMPSTADDEIIRQNSITLENELHEMEQQEHAEDPYILETQLIDLEINEELANSPTDLRTCVCYSFENI